MHSCATVAIVTSEWFMISDFFKYQVFTLIWDVIDKVNFNLILSALY